MLAKLSSKGQVVIPKAVRQALRLRPGTRFRVQLVEGKIILEPITSSPIEVLFGKYSDMDFLTELEREHRQEIARERAVRV